MMKADAGAIAERVGQSFEAAAIPYAIGGALAMGAHGYPRGTLDVDVNVFVEIDGLPQVLGALRDLGAELDDNTSIAAARRDGMFVCRVEGLRVDVFVPSIPFSWEACDTRVRLGAGQEALWFLAPEALAVFKLLFFRGKDRVDLERFVAVTAGRLDTAYVRRWICGMMGEDDERVQLWDDLTRRFGGG